MYYFPLAKTILANCFSSTELEQWARINQKLKIFSHASRENG